MNSVKLYPKKLGGNICVPPSKSISHRALISGGLSDGTSIIDNIQFSNDIEATIDVLSRMGVKVEKAGSDSVKVNGRNRFNFLTDEFDFGESGSTLRFMIPILMLSGKDIKLNGHGRLVQRPLKPYYDIFDSKKISYKNNNGNLPLEIHGKLVPGRYELRGDISSQFITGLMFALPLLNGDSEIVLTTELESKGYVDLTKDMLEKFSIHIKNNDYKSFSVKGNQKYMASDCRIEGDFSQAVFYLAAGLIGDKICIHGLNINSHQGDKVSIDILRRMGAKIEYENENIISYPSKLNGAVIDASECPDIIPVLAAAASVSRGTTSIINAKRLRMKESDRLKSVRIGLSKLGANVIEKGDSLIIEGKDMLEGGEVDSFNDHRIVMCMALASIRCKNPVIIHNSGSIKKSYPEFFDDLKSLGGDIRGE